MTVLPPARPAGQSPVAGRRRWLRRALLAGAVAVPAIALVLLFAPRDRAPAPLTTADVRTAVATAIAKAAEEPPRSTAVYQAIIPSLVVIQTEGSPGDSEGEGIGSGVIVRNDGMILTAHHVVRGARAITVTFADGTKSRAEVLETFPNDLATVRAAQGPELIVPAVLAGGPQVGDEAYAIGNPLGLTGSFSAGVISGLNRNIPAGRRGEGLTGLIQFDAAVNPGSSGGPLLNRNGQVIGIVTALANPSNERAFTGIGFAVPLASAGGAGSLPR